MITTENGCVCCGLPCKGDSCPHYKVQRLCCDKCGDEVDKLYENDDGEQFCESCALGTFKIVE